MMKKTYVMPVGVTTRASGGIFRFTSRAAAGMTAAGLLLGVLTLGGCSSFGGRTGPINSALAAESRGAPVEAPAPAGNFEDTAIGLSFSGGGTRASAFAFGVLRELGRTQIASEGRQSMLIDQVDLVSSVSGGSITAAYFALNGSATLNDFRKKFLAKNVEDSLRTEVSLTNIVRLSNDAALNDSAGLQSWLDEHLFNSATYRDVFNRGRPKLLINASDIYNRTPFVYNQETFASLCSDLNAYPISEAVAASAAVPLVFKPVVIQNFADRCQYEAPRWSQRALRNPNAPAVLRANAEAVQRYRAKSDVKFVKLMDGGLTDNLGLTGILLERLSASQPHEPFSEREAVKMKRLLFIVVDAGRPPGGDWAKNVDTGASDLIQAVADTAVDANIRNTYDTFSNHLRDWNRELIDWRCRMPRERVNALIGDNPQWNCRDVSFHVVKVTFDQMPDPVTRTELEKIPTRFKLPEKSIDLLLDSAGQILRRNSAFQRFLASAQ
jgi:NTE family protein